MAAHHYVSKFHLRAFCDPSGLGTRDPWVWFGNLSDGSVKRRAPKNVGTSPDLFNGPGGLVDEQATLETYLADNVEGPAARELRKITSEGATLTNVPPGLMRYLAWAASRSLPMQRLELEWGLRFGASPNNESTVEPAPSGLVDQPPRIRSVALVHPTLGEKIAQAGEDLSALLDVGWIPDPRQSANFLEGVHIQSYYFQSRWFPRLKWFTLKPPTGKYFILGDRPVGWGVPDCLNAPPCCLRDPSAFLIAPLSRSLILVGRNNSLAWEITPKQVNSVLAKWSYDWIVGPTADVVAEAIFDRRMANSTIQ
jgi:hypothetical protein